MIKDPISKAQIPSILYKYRDAENKDHINILKKLEIYFPSPEKFNDPFDCKIPINYQILSEDKDLAKKFIEKVISNNPDLIPPDSREEFIKKAISNGNISNREFLKFQEEDYISKLNSDFGVYCLSEEPNNILLWSHYGNCHTGFCIGFDTEKLINLDTFGSGGPIRYTNLFPFISPLENALTTIYTQLFNKSLHWEYEKEYRLVKIMGGNRIIKLKPDIITEIHLGCRILPKNKKIITTIRDKIIPNAKIICWGKGSSTFELQKLTIL